MQRLTLLPLAAAAALVAAGAALTLAGGAEPLAQMELKALGWVSVAVIWLAHCRLPGLTENRLAMAAQALLSVGAALGLPIAIAAEPWAPGAVAAVTLAWFAGLVLFATRLVSLEAGPRRTVAAE